MTKLQRLIVQVLTIDIGYILISATILNAYLIETRWSMSLKFTGKKNGRQNDVENRKL